MNVMFDFKVALAIISLIIAFGIFFYNPMMYHAKMLKLQKKVDDLQKATHLLALQVELQKILLQTMASVDIVEEVDKPKNGLEENQQD